MKVFLVDEATQPRPAVPRRNIPRKMQVNDTPFSMPISRKNLLCETVAPKIKIIVAITYRGDQ
jgi:hypothetical protein